MHNLTAPPALEVRSKLLEPSALIYEYTHESATSLIAAFTAAKRERKNPRGALPAAEQDILRAALIMCCAGMDATIKRAITDCLGALSETNDDVRKGFEKFISRQIRGGSQADEASSAAGFLASVLADTQPRQRLVQAYVENLTGESLQSVDQLFKAIAALGLGNEKIAIDKPRLKHIFQVRNLIIHELDIEWGRKKQRKVRSQQDLLDNSDFMLTTVRDILKCLDNLLNKQS